MKRNNKWLIFFVPILILGIGLAFYFSHFYKYYSTDPKDWGSFGSYINPFVTLANVTLFIIFSLLVYQYNNSINRPILTFKTVSKNGKEVWQINNIGNGPALNIVVSYKPTRNGQWNAPAVKCYSLGKNENIDLDWLIGRSVDVIGVYYKDLFSDLYVAIVGDDITEVRKYSGFKSFKISEYSYTKKDFDELLALEVIRINRARNLGNTNMYSSITSETTRKEG